MGKAKLGAVLALALSAPAAQGHELWLDIAGQPAAGSQIVAEMKVGQDMIGTALPYLGRTVERMTYSAGSDDKAIPARDGDLPAVAAPVADIEGLHALTVWTRPAYVVHETMADFEAFLTYEGLDGILAAHRRRGLPDTEIAEEYLRNARSLFQVGDVVAGEVDQPLGAVLEIRAVGNPFATGSQTLPVALTFEGQPLADVQLSVFYRPAELAEGAPATRSTTRTDGAGLAMVGLGGDGAYLLNAVHMVPADGPGSVVWRSYWASLSFRLGG